MNHQKKVEGAWYNGKWQYRKQLTFNNSAQASNLTNFAVMIKLTSSNFTFSQAKSDGSDLRFTDSDGATLLSYEFESYDSSAQAAIIWVKVPQIDASSSTDSIYMYWGNLSAADAQDADNTWNSNYKGVYHLKDNTATTTVIDSSGNGNNITSSENTNNGFYQSSGKIGGATLTAGAHAFITNQTGQNISEVYPDVVLDSNGYPIIAYYDVTNADLVLVHCNDKECKGGNETVNIVDNTNDTGYYPSIRLDGNGYPMIAYQYRTGLDLKYVHCNDVNCAGGNETFSVIETTSSTGYYPRMVLDGSNIPVIAYYYGSGADLKIVHCGNIDCSSGNVINSVDTGGTVGNNLRGTDLVLDTSGFPVMSYYDTTNTELKVAHCNDVNCAGGDESLTSPLATLAKSLGQYTAIELDGSGFPMIAYQNTTDTNLEFIHCDDVNCAGDESASLIVVDTANSMSPLMEKNNSGIPIIVASSNTTYSRVYACANTNCSTSTATYLSLYNAYTSNITGFTLDASDNIYVVTYSRGRTGDYDVILYNTQHKLERAYDSDFDFGTGSFSISAWFKSNSMVQQNTILSRYDNDQGYRLWLNYAGQPCFGIDDDSSWGPDDSACSSNSQIVTNVDNGNAAGVTWQSMVLDINGYPVIAYYDSNSSQYNLELIHCNDANCTGGNETYASLDTTGTVGQTPSLVLDGNGYPVIAYYDATNTDLKIIHCGNANCSSGNVINTIDGVDSVGLYPTLKLDGSGYPVISYYDTTNTSVKLAHCNDVNCSGANESIVTLINDETDMVRHGSESLQLDASGYPMVVYHDDNNGDLEMIHCNDVNCVGGNETKTTIETANDVGDFASMTKDSSGNPVIVHYDGSNLGLRIVHCGNTDCSSGNVANTINSPNNSDFGYYELDVELNASGNPVILSSQLSTWSTYLTVCNDVNCSGGDETNSIVRMGTNYSYYYHSLALDSNSYPIISFSPNQNDLQLIHMNNGTTYTETGGYDDGNWHHMVAVKDGTSSISTYVDGALVGSDVAIAGGTMTGNSASLNLAEEINNTLSTNNWSGYLDEVQIDNTARSAAWVAAQYLSESNTFVNFSSLQTSPRGDNPIAYFKFDEGYGTMTRNTTALSALNSTLGTNASWKTEEQCVSGKCIYVDDTGSSTWQTVYTSDHSSLGGMSSLSVGVWIKTVSNKATQQVVYKRNTSGTPAWWSYKMELNSLKPTFYVVNAAGTGVSSQADTAIELNKWYYLTGVYNGSQVQIYVNTIASDSTPASLTGNVLDSDYNLQIGGLDTASGYYVKGYLDEVKIYPYARTLAQIKTDYNSRGSALGLSTQLGANVKNKDAFSNGLVGYWKMDENTGTTTSDATGNANTSTFYHEAAWSNGKFSSGVTFDGYDDVLKTLSSAGDKLNPANAVSVSTWVNLTTAKSNSYIATKGWGDNYELFLNNDRTITFRIVNTPSSDQQTATTTTTLSTGTWYHIVGTYDKEFLRVYINGQLSASSSYNKTIYQGNQPFSIGGIPHMETAYFNNGFIGVIDETRVYNRALSGKEVRDLYAWAPEPVGYWNFEEGTGTTVNDIAGNSGTGTWYGTGNHWTQGKFGKGGQFNNTDNYINVGNGSPLQLSKTGTVCLWFKPLTTFSGNTGTQKHLMSGGPRDFYFSSSSSILYFFLSDDATGIGSNASSWDTNWHYVCTTSDGTTLKMYINGIQQTSTVALGANNYFGNLSAITIGRSTSSFTGNIDEVKIYNYARTSGQIIEDMNAGHPLGGSPVGSQVGYWKLDEGYSNIANNSGSGGLTINGTLTGTTLPTWTNSGKFSKAINFDGIDDYINISDNNVIDMGTGDYTVSTWFKTSNPATLQMIINHRSGDEWLVGISASKIQTYIYDSGTAHTQTVTGTSTILANTWYYLTVIYSRAGNATIYLNGKVDGSGSLTGIPESIAPSGSLRIGYNSTGNSGAWANAYFNGLIDEVKIYSAALTVDEIKIDYNRGSAMILGTLSDTSGLSGGSISSSSASSAYCIPGDTATCNPPIGEWNFEEGSGTTANDGSGNGNIGTITGAIYTSGKFGKALNFNGSTNFVDTGNGPLLNISDTLTVEAWVKASDYAVDAQRIVSKGNLYYGFQAFRSPTVQNTFTLYMDGDWRYASFGTLVPDTWYHLSGTYSKSTKLMKSYLNGQLITTTDLAAFSGDITSTSDNLQIGRGNIRYFNGLADQVHIFNYARTPAQIAWDYNRGGPIGHWKLDECTSTVANDSSGNGNIGTITIGTTIPQSSTGTCTDGLSTSAWYNGRIGKYNSSLNFDGVDDYVNLSNPSLLNNITTKTISFWTYLNAQVGAGGVGSHWLNKGDSSGGWFIATDPGNSRNIYGQHFGAGTAGRWSFPQFSISQWHHVVVTYDRSSTANNPLIYVDGIPQIVTRYSTPTGTAGDDSANSLLISKSPGNDRFVSGQIDDVRIYNYALTAQQVKIVYNGGAAIQFAPATGTPL